MSNNKSNVQFVAKAKITQTGQVTLPLEARKSLDIDVLDEIYWYEIDGLMIATKQLMNQQDIAKELKRRIK